MPRTDTWIWRLPSILQFEPNLRNIAFIDFLKSGCSRLVNGILCRDSSPLGRALTNPVMTLDALPIPDFEDFPFNNETELVIET